MTDSAVLNTVLGLVFLFYALALLCSGLVEMIANWVSRPEIPRNFCSTPGDDAQCAAEAANLLEAIGIPLGWSAPI
jgi:hypothetical protein